MSDVIYAGDTGLFDDEQDCLAGDMRGEFRYRIFYYRMTRSYVIKVDGTVYDASKRSEPWDASSRRRAAASREAS